MSQLNRIEIVRPQDLTAEDEALWSGFLAQRPDLSGPYFDVRYVKGIGADVPHSGVARIFANGQVVAYFPYQIRSNVLQPLGAPLTDYHGIIGLPNVRVDFDRLLKACGARRLEFQGWVGSMSERAIGVPLTRRVADTTQGYDNWFKTQGAAHHKFFKNMGRCQRNVEKDFGGFAFSWERVTPELLDWVLDLKRAQYRKTGMHDVFRCGWTRTLLDNLAKSEDSAFGLRAAVFRHEGRIVAAEIGLMGPDEVHLWFPSYDPAYYRYSVGILLTVAIIENVTPLGIKRFDFGTGGEEYKSPLTTEGGPCFEGEYSPSPQVLSVLIDRAAGAVPVARERITAARLSLKRRVKLIRATETHISGWGQAMLSLSQRAFMRVQPPKAVR